MKTKENISENTNNKNVISFNSIKNLFQDAEFENHPIRKDDEVYYVSSDVYLVQYVGDTDFALKFDFTFIESYSDRDENGCFDSSGELKVDLKGYYTEEDKEIEINEEIKLKVVKLIENKIMSYYR